MGGRGEPGRMPMRQDAKRQVGQLTVTPLPSCQCEQHGGLACRLRGDETPGAL